LAFFPFLPSNTANKNKKRAALLVHNIYTPQSDEEVRAQLYTQREIEREEIERSTTTTTNEKRKE